MNRIFDHFPSELKEGCPLCSSKRDAPCFLMPIDGTDDGGTCEAVPTHVDCITEHLDRFRYHRETGLVYTGRNK